MLETYLKPKTISEAVEYLDQYGDQAFFLAGGTKANAAPTKITKPVALSLELLKLDDVTCDGDQLTLGAGHTLQQLIDHELTPAPLRDALGFIYSRHVRNQATLGGEIAAKQEERRIIPTLLAMQAELTVVTVAGEARITLEDYLATESSDLITAVVLPQRSINCCQLQQLRSAGGLRVLTAAVSLPQGQTTPIIAIDGMSPTPMRLRDVEPLGLELDALEKAVAEAIQPVEDLCGSVEYKRYIAGVSIADLLVQCQQEGK